MEYWSGGAAEEWVFGGMGIKRKNKNRGYQQLRVWEDAIKLYAETGRLLGGWPFEMKRIASQAMASADSIHRNIAEGYCRRSLRAYIHYLYIALGSLGEIAPAYHADSTTGQLPDTPLD